MKVLSDCISVAIISFYERLILIVTLKWVFLFRSPNLSWFWAQLVDVESNNLQEQHKSISQTMSYIYGYFLFVYLNGNSVRNLSSFLSRGTRAVSSCFWDVLSMVDNFHNPLVSCSHLFAEEQGLCHHVSVKGCLS